MSSLTFRGHSGPADGRTREPQSRKRQTKTWIPSQPEADPSEAPAADEARPPSRPRRARECRGADPDLRRRALISNRDAVLRGVRRSVRVSTCESVAAAHGPASPLAGANRHGYSYGRVQTCGTGGSTRTRRTSMKLRAAICGRPSAGATAPGIPSTTTVSYSALRNHATASATACASRSGRWRRRASTPAGRRAARPCVASPRCGGGLGQRRSSPRRRRGTAGRGRRSGRRGDS